MAKINGGKGFENFDIEAYKIEQAILAKEREEAKNKPKRGRPAKPRIEACIYCESKFEPRAIDFDINDFETLDELVGEYDDNELYDCICKKCRGFWGINKDWGGRDPFPGWNPKNALDRLHQAEELGYATILKSQTFGTPSGDTIDVEFGDVFPIKRVSSSDTTSSAKTFYSIDIMVGMENLILFPWEFGTVSWAELMLSLRDGEMEAVYLGSDDVAGYYEPNAEIKQMLKNQFGER